MDKVLSPYSEHLRPLCITKCYRGIMGEFYTQMKKKEKKVGLIWECVERLQQERAKSKTAQGHLKIVYVRTWSESRMSNEGCEVKEEPIGFYIYPIWWDKSSLKWGNMWGRATFLIPFNYIAGLWPQSKGVTVSGRVIFYKLLLEKIKNEEDEVQHVPFKTPTAQTAIILSDARYASSICIFQLFGTWHYSLQRVLFHWVRNFTILSSK